MREVYFESENAIPRVSYDDVVERLSYFESTIGTAETTTLRDLLSHSDHSIRIPKEQYRTAYLALDLIERGKGVVYCKAYKRYYEGKKLKRVVVGHGESHVGQGKVTPGIASGSLPLAWVRGDMRSPYSSFLRYFGIHVR